jgi:hypothetical protein
LTNAERGYDYFRESGRLVFRGLGCYFEFDRSQLTRPDDKTQADIDAQRVNSGIRTLNEVRATHNWPAAPPEVGDQYRIPTQVTVGVPPEPAESVPKNSTEQNQTEDKTDAVNQALRELLTDRVNRFADIEADQINKAAARGGNFLEWLDKWLGEHERRLKDAAVPIFRAIDAANGSETEPKDAEQWAKRYADSVKNAVLSACEVPANRLSESVSEQLSTGTIPALRVAHVNEVFQ